MTNHAMTNETGPIKATKAQVLAVCKSKGLELIENEGGNHWDVEVMAPKGYCIEPELHSLVTCWGIMPGHKGEFWREVFDNVETVRPEKCPADCHCKD